MRRASLLLLALVLGVALGYPDVWLWSSHPPGDDDLEFVVPFSMELVDAYRAGRFPVWNPHIDGGVSFFARFPYLEPFYPSVVLFAWLSPVAALDASLFLHLLLAAGGAAFLALTLGARAPASLVAGLVYAHSSAFRANVGEGYLTAIVAFAWWPWMLAALWRAIAAADRRVAAGWVGAGGAALGAMMLGGQPTDLLACGGLTAVALAVAAPVALRRGALPRAAAVCAGVVLLGAALGATFWWPALEAVALSGGAPELPMKAARGGSFSDLVTFAFPHRSWGTSFDRHLSFPALVLAGGALVRARGRATTLAAVVAAVAFVLSLGQATPLWSLLRAALPPFRSVDTSVAYVSGLALAVAVLAALAFDRIRSRRLVPVLALLLAVDALVYQLPAWIRERPVEEPATCSAAGMPRYLANHAEGDRILPLEMEVPEPEMLFQRNEVMRLGLESLRLSSHFPARRTAELLARIDGLLVDWRDFSDERARLRGRVPPVTEPVNARILDLFAVRWILTDVVLPELGEPVRDAAPWRIYQRDGVPPRVRLLTRAKVVGEDRCLDTLLDPAFEPDVTALLPPGGGALHGGPPDETLPPRVQVRDRQPGRILVRVQAPHPGVLLSGETWDPGWRATLDGEPLATFPVHCAFTGVHVPVGTHYVELRFVPPGLHAGLATGAAGLLALAALVTPALRARFGRSRATASTGRP